MKQGEDECSSVEYDDVATQWLSADFLDLRLRSSGYVFFSFGSRVLLQDFSSEAQSVHFQVHLQVSLFIRLCYGGHGQMFRFCTGRSVERPNSSYPFAMAPAWYAMRLYKHFGNISRKRTSNRPLLQPT
jgi:hypothetical protein